jgi:hypothetical protein
MVSFRIMICNHQGGKTVAGRLPTSKIIREQTGDIKVCREADALVERSGYLEGMDSSLVACRAFSSDLPVQEYFNLIPHCVAFGQASATAAQAIQNGTDIREVDCRALQDSLIKQGVPLPGVYTALSKA